MSETQHAGPSAADLLDLFGGSEGTVYARTLQQYRHAVVAHTGIDAIPYAEGSIARWLDAGGEQRVLDALADAVEDREDTG